MDSDSENEGYQDISESWLDEVDEVDEESAEVKFEEFIPKVDPLLNKSDYIKENADLFFTLCEVDDFGFETFSIELQEQLMRSLKIVPFEPGTNIITEGDNSIDCYIVHATGPTADVAEVEVVTGNILAGTEVRLCSLHRGQYFGQKYFLTKRAVSRE